MNYLQVVQVFSRIPNGPALEMNQHRHCIAEPLAQNPDILIADLVEAEVIRKKIARMVASRTWFRKPGHQYQPAEWSYLMAKTSPETIAFVQKMHGVETVILGHNHSTLD